MGRGGFENFWVWGGRDLGCRVVKFVAGRLVGVCDGECF